MTKEGRFIDALREKHGLSLRALAFLAGVSRNCIYEIRRGKRYGPRKTDEWYRTPTLDKVLRVFGQDRESLARWDEEMISL